MFYKKFYPTAFKAYYVYMRKLVLNISALTIMLSLGSVLFVSMLNFNHAIDEHEMTAGMTDCPFMAHDENLCPMTALSHLSMLRGLFETTLPTIRTLTLVIGVALVPLFFTFKMKPLLRLHSHTFLRWRKNVTHRFSYRPFQDLFSRGILNPKLF